MALKQIITPPGSQVLSGKRILFVFTTLELGGAERQAILLARHLMEQQQAEVEFWGFRTPGRASDLCDEYGIPWCIVPFCWTPSRRRRVLNLARFAQSLRRARPDIVMPYTMQPNVVCGLVWRWSGARACVWNQRDEGRGRMEPFFEGWSLRLTPWYISNSYHGAGFLTHVLGVPSRRMRVIYNGIEPWPEVADPSRWRRRLGLDDDTFIAAMVANLTQHKDHATLLKAWRLVLDRLKTMRKDALLLLAGRLDEATDSLKAIAYDLDLGNSVRFLGRVDDIPSLLAATDLGVLSSRLEGCPNGVLECMAAGLPVVATDIPGIREALGEACDDCLAAPGDERSLADRMVDLFLNPGLREYLGKRNRQRILERFRPQRMVQETIDLLEAILG